MLRHHFVRELCQLFQRLAEFIELAIAHRDSYITQKTPVLGALDRAVAEDFSKLILAERSQFFERRREVTRFKRRLSGYRRTPIPGAHVLADVATKHVLADRGAHIFGHRSMQFNGEVRNAAPCIDLVSFEENGLRRTRFDAAPKSASRMGGFLMSIAGAMQNWNDNTQARSAGVRDRVVRVRLSKIEGGMNLNMPSDVIMRQ